MDVNKYLSIACCYLLSFHLQAQSEVEQRPLVFENEPLTQVLAVLDDASSHQLSYNPQILPVDQKVSGTYSAATVEEALLDILGTGYKLKSIGNYIVIQKEVIEKSVKTSFQLIGDIKDEATGEKLEDVSIYEVNTLQSTLTNGDGKFKLITRTKVGFTTIAISKENYLDTIIRLGPAQSLSGTISLKKGTGRSSSIQVFKEQANQLSNRFVNFFTSNSNRKNARNVSLVDERFFQLSLIPSLSTNRKLSSQVTNRLSINMIAGYSYGLRGLEMGGFYNMVREDAYGLQLGGFGNSAGGKVQGVQMGGALNTTEGHLRGIQLAGAVNVASDSVNGFQMAGATNVTKQLRGAQIAGFNNHAHDMRGLALSGFINTAKRMDGLQVAGFINKADEMRGVQLGVINFADSVTAGGVQIGLLNFSKNGIFSPSIMTDDVIPIHAGLRTGMDYFYAILSLGINPGEYGTAGMGFGGRAYLHKKRKLFFNPELESFSLISDVEVEDDAFSNWIKLQLKLGYQLFDNLSVTAGPTVNFYATNQLTETGVPIMDIAHNPFFEEGSSTIRQMWIGYSVGVGF